VKRTPALEETASFHAELERAKRRSTAHLLLKCARLVNEEAIASLPSELATGFRPRPAHMALFPHIDLEGTRQSALAERVGISKQAVGQLVDDLQEAGVLARIPDASDRRAKRVVFTPKGREGMLAGLEHLRSVEKDLTKAIGRDTMAQLRDALLALHDHLEE
jgi:DNA-binding MarR family transcriptional regulator